MPTRSPLPPAPFQPHGHPLPGKLIETDPAKARRVDASLPKKLGKGARSCVAHAFLSGSEEKELLILRFLRLGYRVGPGVMFMAGHKDVAPVLALGKAVCGEAHLLTGFVRFQDYGDFLGSTITPKHYVLPLLRLHFCQRLPGEDFILYDATHGAALLWQKGKASYAQLDEGHSPSRKFPGRRRPIRSCGSGFTRPSPSSPGRPGFAPEPLPQAVLGKHDRAERGAVKLITGFIHNIAFSHPPPVV